MGNASSIFDCATNPLNPALEDEAAGADGEGSENRTVILEEGVPLRSSLLWRLQRAFYEDKGLTAWSEGIVPNFVTSNSFIARGYARSILSMLQDVYGDGGADGTTPRNPHTDYSQPVYIIELGAGHGKLGYLICEALLRYRAFFPKAVDCPFPFKYVLTDAIERDVEAWSVHPNLKEFIELGVLDTAVFDAERDQSFVLRKSGLKITGKGALANPCVVIANYCFDSLTTDALRLENGNLQQCAVTLSIPNHFLNAAAAVDAANAASRMGAMNKEDSGNGSDADGHAGMAGPHGAGQELGGAAASGAGAGDAGSSASAPAGVTVAVQVPVPAPTTTPNSSTSKQPTPAPPASTSPKGTSSGSSIASTRTVHVSPSLLNRIQLTWSHVPVPNSSASPAGSPNDHSYRVYGDAFLDGLVSAYASSRYLQNAGSILLPIGGFAALRTLLRLSNGRMAVFVGDKGYSRLNEMEGLRDPHLALHGSLSFMVNLHALRQFTKAHGGVVLQTPHYEGFKSSVLLFGSEDAGNGPLAPLTTTFPIAAAAAAAAGAASPSSPGFSDDEDDADLGTSTLRITRPGYREDIEAYSAGMKPPVHGPVAISPLLPSSLAALPYRRLRLAVSEHLTHGFTVDDFSTLQRNVKDECPEPSLKHVLALLALANHDADVFYKFKGVLIEKTPSAPADTVLRDVRSDVDRLFAGYYPLQKSKDICFECGRLLMGVRDYGSAIDFFARSNELCGEHHVTWHNMGICCYYLGDYDNALECFKSSLALKPEYAEARLWWDKASSKRTSLANQQQQLQQQGAGAGGGAALADATDGEFEDDENDDDER